MAVSGGFADRAGNDSSNMHPPLMSDHPRQLRQPGLVVYACGIATSFAAVWIVNLMQRTTTPTRWVGMPTASSPSGHSSSASPAVSASPRLVPLFSENPIAGPVRNTSSRTSAGPLVLLCSARYRQLPDDQRAALAAHLLSSLPGILHDDDGGIAEAMRRDAELDCDPAAGMTLEQFRSAFGR